MMKHPDTVIGLGNGGAHLATICDGSLPTFMLTLLAALIAVRTPSGRLPHFRFGFSVLRVSAKGKGGGPRERFNFECFLMFY